MVVKTTKNKTKLMKKAARLSNFDKEQCTLYGETNKILQI